MPAKIKYPVINGLKECGECKQFLPISEFKKSRNHFVSRCQKCLSAYMALYRHAPENKKKSAEYHKQYMADQENRKRTNEYNKKRNKRADVRVYRNSKRREWASKEKQKAVDYKGGKCIFCGYDKCLAAMDFHHKNPLEKDGYGTGALKSHWTFEKNKTEIDKCVLVCVRCHREIHAGIITL